MNTFTPFQHLPIHQVHPSKTNPRKRFTEEQLQELADNIKQHGIMQPILVRPIDKRGRPAFAGDEIDHYEIVAGERRWRASKQAGLDGVPVIVRELADLEAMRLQVFENLHRADLHPIEEAEGFQRLLEKSQDLIGLSVDELAVQVGKSRSHIYASQKLLALCEQAREAFFDGKFHKETAVLIGRIPGKKLQMMAVASVTSSDGPMSYRAAARIIQDRYTLHLDKAVFDIKDAGLVESAGDCGSCHKRSGNCSEICQDINSPDVCTDPDCFAEKRAAHVARLEEQGKRVITGKQADEIAPHNGLYLRDNTYAKKTSSTYHRGLNSISWEDALGEDLPDPITIVTDNGTVLEIYEQAAMQEKLEARIAAGKLAVEPEKPREPNEWEIKREARRHLVDVETARRTRIFNAIRAATQDEDKLNFNFGGIIRLAITMLDDFSANAYEILAKANGYEGNSQSDFIEQYLSTPRTNRELMSLLIQVLIADAAVPGYSWDSPDDNEDDKDLDRLESMAIAFGIDLDQPAPETEAPDAFKNIKEKELAKRARRAKKPEAEEVAA